MELVGALLGSLLGAVVALVAAGARLRFETRQWRQDALVRGMGFLTGGRQERSVGIGLLESLIMSGNVPEDIRPAVTTCFGISSFMSPIVATSVRSTRT